MERPISAGQRLAPIGATQGQKNADADAESIADKYFVCTECLIGGHVQSFIELFYLTHLTQQSAASVENQKVSSEISSGTLHFLKQILTRAENSQRSGDMLAVVDCYKALAEHYEAEEDHRTALYFTEKCLEVSKLCGDKRAEAEANRLLGFCHEHLGNADLSLKHHEVQRDIARSLADSEEILDANRHLIDAYVVPFLQCLFVISFLGTRRQQNSANVMVNFKRQLLCMSNAWQLPAHLATSCQRVWRAFPSATRCLLMCCPCRTS